MPWNTVCPELTKEECSGHGRCKRDKAGTNFDYCECDEGFTGPDRKLNGSDAPPRGTEAWVNVANEVSPSLFNTLF